MWVSERAVGGPRFVGAPGGPGREHLNRYCSRLDETFVSDDMDVVAAFVDEPLADAVGVRKREDSRSRFGAARGSTIWLRDVRILTG